MTLWTVACQAYLSLGFPRQEYWNGLPCPPPEDLPDPGIEPESFMSPALGGRFFTNNATQETTHTFIYLYTGLLLWLSGKESACNAGTARDVSLIPGSGRSSGGGHGNPLQYSCLENSMDRGAWQTTVHGVAESDTTKTTEHAHRYSGLFLSHKNK